MFTHSSMLIREQENLAENESINAVLRGKLDNLRRQHENPLETENAELRYVGIVCSLVLLCTEIFIYLTGLSLLTRKLRSQLKNAKDNMTTLMKELITFVDTHYPPTTFGVRKVMDIIAITEKTGESS